MQATDLECVHVPAGKFDMGTDSQMVAWLRQNTPWASEWDDAGFFEAEPHQVIALPDYQISTYPVTVGAYREFVDSGAYVDSRWWSSPGRVWLESQVAHSPAYWENPRWTDDPALPVVGVSWFEAVAYCTWLTHRTNHTYRLPTEAEWEKAARGTDRRVYPWGDLYFSGYANVDETHFDMGLNQMGQTTPVDTYPDGISPYGVFDMSGNVWEWTSSTFDGSGSTASDGDSKRVVRGGAWDNAVPHARTSYRTPSQANNRRYNLGFRVVRED